MIASRRKFLKAGALWLPALLIGELSLDLSCEQTEAQALTWNDPVVSDDVSSGSTALPPLPQLSNLLAYWESDDFDGSTNSSLITAWNDKNGGGSNTQWVPRSTGNGPIVDGSTTLNGHKTVSFRATSQQGMKSGSTFIPSSGITGGEVWLVFKNAADPPPASPGTNPLFRFNSADTQENEQPYTDGNFYDGTFQNSRPSRGNPTTSTSSSFVVYRISAKSDGTSYKAYINNENFYSSSSFTFQSRGSESTYSLGWNDPAITGGTPGPYGSMNAAGMYVWKVQFGATDVTTMKTYVNAKWAISL